MFIVFVVIILALDTSAVIFPSIPNHLIPCYRSDGPNITAPYRLDVFLSTLQTLERNTQLDLRMFTTTLLRSLRLDGIERGLDGIETTFVTPYHASSFQFHKYKILMDIFLPSQNLNLVDDIEASLSVGERCILHKMLSSTVSYRERGDENIVCSEVVMPRQTPSSNNYTRSNSRCPIESGVIQTDWGTISIGTIVGAIAATTESQRVLVSDILSFDLFRSSLAEEFTTKLSFEIETSNVPTNVEDTTQTGDVGISNIWVATLAGTYVVGNGVGAMETHTVSLYYDLLGDLAEVVVNQGPRVGFRSSMVILGGDSKWNDTVLPRNYYMLNHTSGAINWQITDPEILAGIDGLIISQYLPKWMEERESLKLSQIIDMYYSNDGVTFSPTVKACNRESLFTEVLDLNVLYKEVKDFSRILFLRQGSVYIPPEVLDNIAVTVVDAFVEYYPSLLKRYNKRCGVSNDIPMMDVVMVTDGSWIGYDVEQFTSWLGGASEVGVSGSSVSLLHGNTATWVVPPSNNLTIFYEHVRNYTGDWPTRLNFPNILSFLMRHLENKTIAEADNKVSVTPSTVVLIISPSDRLSETESARAKDLMNTLRATYFDVYFDYISQDLTGFKEISGEFYDYSELFLQVSSTAVSDIITGVKEQIISKQVPKSIVGAHCNYNDTVFTQIPYEDFVQPNKTNEYRIHSYYLQQQQSIQVQILNSIQGFLKVCTWRGSENADNCNVLDPSQTNTVTLTNPCPSKEFCPPAYISITGVTSNNMCANNDCRYPHSISYHIQHSGLRCLPLRGNSAGNSPIFMFYIVIVIIIVIL